MKLELHRKWLTADSTIGELFVDGSWECFVLEDRYRPPPEPKVPKQTAIPCGKYQVDYNRSPRFSELAGHDVFRPLLLNVPGFEGVRIHPGNTKEDTDGCLLPGLGRGTNCVTESVVAYQRLEKKILEARARGESVSISITIV